MLSGVWFRLATAAVVVVAVAGGGAGEVSALPGPSGHPHAGAVTIVTRSRAGSQVVPGTRPSKSMLRKAALTIPTTPFVTPVIAEGLGLLVSWNPDPPTDQVTSYSVTVSAAAGVTPPPGCAGPFGLTVDASNSAGLVRILCTGVAYVATVSATNAAGTSPTSPNSAPVVPLAAQAPQAPLIGSVLGRDTALVVSWSPPAGDGGAAVTGFTVTATAGSSNVTVSASASATSATVSGLTDGTVYGVTVVATNIVGSSPAASGTGTPKVAYVPGGPSTVTATPDGSGAVSVSWAAPTDDGGNSISSYTISWQQVVPSGRGYVPAPGSTPHSVTVGASSTSVLLSASGFGPAAALYSITVAATNGVGSGAATPTSSPVAPVTTVTSKAVVLSSTTMSALASDTPNAGAPGSVLLWPAPAPVQITKLKAGKVLVAAPVATAPQGLLDTVNQVSVDSSGNYTVTTSPAALTSVFSTLALSSTSNPLTTGGSIFTGAGAGGVRFRPAAAGVRNLGHNSKSTISFSPSLTLGVNLSTGTNGGFVTGEVDIEPNLSLNMSLDHGFAGVPDGVGLSASASLKVTDSLRVGIQGSYSHEIGEIDSPPIDIQVGPVPVVIVPKVPIFVNVSGQIGISVSASVTIGAGLSWDSRHATTLTVTNLSVPPQLTSGPIPGLSVTGQLNVGFSVQPQIAIYDLAGPNVEGDLLAVADVNLTPPPGAAYLSVTPEIQLKAGLDVDVLGFHESLELSLATKVFTTFTILQAPTATLAITPSASQVLPGQTQQFTATRSDRAGGHPVTWTLAQAAGDTISSSGLFTATNPSGRSVTVYATDDTGATGQTTLTIGTPYDTVANLSATQDSTDLGAQVSWAPPGSTGGSPIAFYTVTVSNGVASQTTTGNAISVAGLHPGITYTITVYPSNGAGQTGPPASTTLRVIPLCTDTFTGGVSGTGTSWATAANWSANRVPAKTDWVCVSGTTINMPAGSATVQGLQQPSGSTLVIPSGGTLTVTNTFGQSGTLSGPGTVAVPAGSTATLVGSFGLTNGVHVLNRGTMEIQAYCGCGGIAGFNGGSVLENAATLALDDNANLGAGSDGNPTNQLINDAGATITYNGPSTATISVPVADKGAIAVGAGILTISTITPSGSPSISGPGIASLGSVNVGGTVAVSGTWTLTGPLSGPGTLTVPAGSHATLSGSFSLSSVRLLNQGTTEIQAYCGCGGIAGFNGGSMLENAATLLLDDNANLGAGSDGNPANQLLNDAGATITYNGSSTGASATISVSVADSGAVAVATGTLNISSPISISNTASFTGAGTIAINSFLTPAGPGATVADMTVNGTLSGPGTLTVASGSTVTMANGSTVGAGLDLINQGNLTLASGAQVGMKQGSLINNAGTFTTRDGSVLLDDDNTGNALFNNAGATVGYPGGSSGADLAVTFDNHGAVSVGSGTLIVSVGNSAGAGDTGGYTIAQNGIVSFTGGTRELSTTAVITGPGVFDVNGSSLTDSAGWGVPQASMSVDSGILTFPTAVTVNHLTVDGGTVAGPGEVTVPSNGTAQLGPIGGSTGATLLGLRLVNQGNATLAPAKPYGCAQSVCLQGGAIFQNQGVLTFTDGSSIDTVDSQGEVFLNDAGASITYAGGATGAGIAVAFDNHGTVNVGTGTLTVSGGNSPGANDTGKYTITNNGMISFAGGIRDLSLAATVTGPGTFDVNGSDLTDSAAWGTTQALIAVDSGTLSFPTAETINKLTVDGGTLAGPGTVTIPAGGTANLGPLGNSPGATLQGLRLINQGTAKLGAANPYGCAQSVCLQAAAVLENQAALILADGSSIYAADNQGEVFVNDAGATTTYVGGTKGSSLYVAFDNHGAVSVGSGNLSLQTGNSSTATDSGTYTIAKPGTLNVNGGTRILSATASINGTGHLDLNGGSLSDDGKISVGALVVSSGTLEMAPGIAVTATSLKEQNGGYLRYDLNTATPQVLPAAVNVSGTAVLGGGLILAPQAGYAPAVGTTLYLMQYTNKSGTFTSVSIVGGADQFTVNIGPTAATATVSKTSLVAHGEGMAVPE
jgi:large repetitive protein